MVVDWDDFNVINYLIKLKPLITMGFMIAAYGIGKVCNDSNGVDFGRYLIIIDFVD